MGCVSQAGRGEPFGVCYAHDRNADARVSADQSGGDAGATDYRVELVNQVSSHAGAFRFLLWVASSDDLRCFRSFLSSENHSW